MIFPEPASGQGKRPAGNRGCYVTQQLFFGLLILKRISCLTLAKQGLVLRVS